ncbi:hypothetical protein ACFOOK_26825 [Micromonospora krabiensis]|uniref:Uncharacterized protein n=1 Tax=Micromonospora krabiensis TaxID=307121 RepID=A0A1C3N5H3_9ACTN|nr:hypothetical protein [Micromonospora krabiensis]SBV27818.1 hypothetical protein GA0070620_3348 [Micromonospora krabiensis]
MLTYYVVYRNDERVEPGGIFVVDAETGDAILWDHRRATSTYEPGLVVRFLDDHRNLDRYETVARSDAEALSARITGGESLPDETTIRSLFRHGDLGADPAQTGEPDWNH